MVGRCSQVLDHRLLGQVTGHGSRVAGYFGGSRVGVTVRGSQASVVGNGSWIADYNLLWRMAGHGS